MLVLLASFALAAPTHGAMDSASWSEVTTRNHSDAGTVRVLSTKIDGVDCFRGEATVDVPGSKLLDVVADVAGAKRWSSAGVTQAEELARNGNTVEYYQYLDVPGWTMASDRFWFLTADIASGGGTHTLKWSKLDQGGPHKATYEKVKADNSGAVEPPVNVGSWAFVDSDGGTKMTYSVCTDSGGSIPAAVQSAATKKTLPDTLGDVVREAKRR